MRDEDIRILQRIAAETKSEEDIFAYRYALVRAGRGKEAGLMVGDIVRITEVESPWILGEWFAMIDTLFKTGERP